jgi:hypothetical protein
MRRGTELVVDAIEMLTAAGAKPLVRSGGKHVKIIWLDRSGHRCTLVIACTPSDRRARANARAMLRRLLRRSGSVAGLRPAGDGVHA